MVKKLTSNLKATNEELVRLTKNEMSQLLKMQIGQIFKHINLQHSDTNVHKTGTKFLAVKLTKIGKQINGVDIPPKLDFTKTVKLKLIDTVSDIPIRNVDQLLGDGQYILDNKDGISDSLYDRYSKVRNLKRDEIMNMNCYIRTFRIISKKTS